MKPKNRTTKGAKRRAPAARKLPSALAKRVALEVDAKKQRLAAQAKDDINLIARRRLRISEDFFEVGLALARLKKPSALEALGHPTFQVLLQVELDMSVTKAERLIAMVTKAPRELVTRLGQDRVSALMALADATPADDTASSSNKRRSSSRAATSST